MTGKIYKIQIPLSTFALLFIYYLNVFGQINTGSDSDALSGNVGLCSIFE